MARTIDISLYPHQQKAIRELRTGSILCGGVGTGKSRTALYYYWERVLGRNTARPSSFYPLYIITTARKRDSKDWEEEAKPFRFQSVVVDSWNNIKKYAEVKKAFFIFDEQRVVGYGAWSKTFIKISKSNDWILLTATPGDTWMDYIPVFIANGYYRNKTDFINQHVVYSRFSKFPRVDKYVNTGKLIRQRNDILVNMEFQKKTVPHDEMVWVPYDKTMLQTVMKTRWNPYREKPIKNISGLCYVMRRVINSDYSRVTAVRELVIKHRKVIIFYNFDYELDLLRELAKDMDILAAEWNGHKHEPVPEGCEWMYLVQYTSGSEAWNCIETNAMIFFSQNYSYKIMAQSAGRIDRLNTPYTDLYYYHLVSKSGIDLAIRRAVKAKKTFNEKQFIESF